MIRRAVFSSALILIMVAITQLALAQKPVKVELRRGEKGRVTNQITNSCSAPHTFEMIKPPEAEWLSLIGERVSTVAPGAGKNFVFEIDSSDLEVGTYFVEVPGTCSDCANQPGCGPVKFTFPIQLKVRWSRPELKSWRADEYVARQVLVALNVEPSKDIDRVVLELENQYQLKHLKLIKLSSIRRILVLFAILNPNDEVPLVVSNLEGAAGVDSSQPNFIHTASVAQTQNYEALQYSPKLIKADLARRYSTGKGVRIALVDTGIDDEHKDLSGRIMERKNFTDDEGYRQDAHGTIMAGIIAAIPHNGFGIAGVAPNAKIISIKVLKQKSAGTAPTGTADVIVQGVDFAIQKRANVVNMSFGSPRRDSEVARIVKTAVRRGAVVVAAAGNSGPRGLPTYPAALDEVIAVSAVGHDYSFYASGTTGDYIDLTAPGVDILSTSPGNIFRPSTGTSEAAAHVTGVVSLLLEKRPNTSPMRIKDLLESTSTDLGDRGRDRLFGSGLVNACKSLEALLEGSRMCTDR
jgi:subtilase family protein